jgi:metallo-beta-lactamase family protein
MKITFLGAAEEVTGSRYLVEHEGVKILVDCGLFHGDKKITNRNWDPFPLDPRSIDALVLTHAHIDHTGYIPLLVKNGFSGKIYCSKATYALCSLLLLDSGHLQEEDAKNFDEEENAHHSPAVPLYTSLDAEISLKSFQTIEYDTAFKIGPLQVTLIRSGHILGSSFVVISDGTQKLTFSGDLGRPQPFLMKAPPQLKYTDFLVIESTYGNRLHKEDDPVHVLGDIVNETVKRGGLVIIPAFAVGRTQIILYCLYQLLQKKAIPDIPIFLDSPMAISVTDLFREFKDEHLLSPSLCKDVCKIATYTRMVEESKRIDRLKTPAIIIAGGGMADGGRVVHHLKRFISDAKNTVMFVGFQAVGTTGRALVDGAQEITIHGRPYQVNASIKTINSLSAHADYNEILEWMGSFDPHPKMVFVTHREIEAARSLKEKIEGRFGWPVVMPKYLEAFDLK